MDYIITDKDKQIIAIIPADEGECIVQAGYQIYTDSGAYILEKDGIVYYNGDFKNVLQFAVRG